jgi:quercetin dioxygenase-like cupin family protein
MAAEESFHMRRLGALPDGNTTVDTIELAWTPWSRGGVSGLATRLLEGRGVLFRHLRVDAGEWHAAPDKQLVIVLEGHGQIEASDGSTIDLEPGSVVLMDHAGTKGHFNRSLGPTGLLVAFIPLAGESV